MSALPLANYEYWLSYKMAETPRSTYIKWAVLAGVPVTCYLLATRGRRPGGADADADADRTDFDGFLKKVEPVGSTGCAAPTPGTVSGSIDMFFRDAGQAAADADTRNPLDFDSFLRSAGAAKPSAAVATAPTSAKVQQPQGPKPDEARVLVMFGTEYGFSKEIAENLCSKLREAGGFWPVLRDMGDCEDGMDFSHEQAVLMACSTQGDGVPPTEARAFCEWLFAGKAGPLAHLKYSVCALGDKSYTHFCRCGKQLDEALQQAGAACLVPRVDVNKEDWPAVDAWIDSVVVTLKAAGLKPVGSAAGAAAADEAAAAQAHHSVKKWGKSRPYAAAVVALEPLCTPIGQDDKVVVRAEFDLGESGVTYVPGDALGIYPTNSPQAVAELLVVLGASADEPVPVPSWHYEEAGVSYEGGKMPLGHALAKCYDLRSPKPELLKLLLAAAKAAPASTANGHGHGSNAANGHASGNGHAANGDGAAAAGRERLSAALADAKASEVYLSARHVVDVLQEVPSAHLTTSQVLGALRQLQPRLYSISSSPLEGASRVQVTVAEVKYASLGKDRIGVCSTYLSERLQIGSHVHVYVHRNPDFRLPADPATPILMVGPGTGLAPFRSFILERLLQQEQQQRKAGGAAPGQMVLYFGCRRSDQDYLYGPLLEGWAAEGKIKLFTAFSRQQARKVYVQQRLAESGDLVWQLLQAGGHFYVCGDASSMAGQVEEALLGILEARLGQGRAGAQAYLKAMADCGRYQRDVWY